MAVKEVPLLVVSCFALSAALFSTLAWNSRASLHRTVEARVAASADILVVELAGALARGASVPSNNAAPRAGAGPADMVLQAALDAATPPAPPQPCPTPAEAASPSGEVVSPPMAGETAAPTLAPCVRRRLTPEG